MLKKVKYLLDTIVAKCVLIHISPPTSALVSLANNLQASYSVSKDIDAELSA